MNTSTLTKFKQYLNEYANTRDYLIEYLVNLPITTLENIELQSSVLVQLTNAINQLTRTTCVELIFFYYSLNFLIL
jgi:2-phosphoglycerate kinase